MNRSRGKNIMTTADSHISNLGLLCRQRLPFVAMISVCLFVAAAGTAAAQQPDSTARHTTTLHEIVVAADKTPTHTQSIVPTQTLSHETLEHLGATQVSDIVSHIAGVTLKDYGGIGGMKTISARGLGSQFSTLAIDGVAVSDAQNGQIDLGRYLLDGSAAIHFANGQQDNLLQAARCFAAGNIVNMETRQPRFFLSQRTNLRLGFDFGSFGRRAPSILLERKLNKKMALAISANYIRSDGDYPFTLFYTANHSDSSSTEYRTNSQMWMLASDINYFFNISPRHLLSAKAHWMKADYHLPGAVLYYTSKASERSANDIVFAQTKYRWNSLSDKWKLQLIGKFQHSDDTYQDTATDLYNDYIQNEGYLSATLLFSPSRHYSLSLANDGAINSFNSNLASNNSVTRFSNLHVLAATARWPRFSLNGNILVTNCQEESNSGTFHHWTHLSPFVGTNITLLDLGDSLMHRSHKLHLRYFFKENYRTPNFSELYFSDFHSDLRPEKALQHNIGLTYSFFLDSIARCYNVGGSLTVDAYLNRVNDKIVAIPTQSMFIWSMINLGQALITGCDVKGSLEGSIGRCHWTADITYSYQKAVDKTNPDSKTYGHQIAYTPLHSGSAALFVESPLVNIGYNITWVGTRFSANQNTEKNRLPTYADQGLSIGRKFNLRLGSFLLQGHILNIFNVQYEIVRNYPMMGRNYRLSITYSF